MSPDAAKIAADFARQAVAPPQQNLAGYIESIATLERGLDELAYAYRSDGNRRAFGLAADAAKDLRAIGRVLEKLKEVG